MPHYSWKKSLGLFGGPLSFTLLFFVLQPDGLNPSAQAVLAVTAWVAIWWISEAIPIAATALLPIVLFPLCGGLAMTETLHAYSHPYIFLFVGGFMLAIAMEKWNLHQRLALLIIQRVGFSKPRILLGFMLATAFLSMWISNTATTVMMLPIGMAMLSGSASNSREGEKFNKALMLAIAYSASIGGIATLIGTPPNLILAGVIQKTYNIEITFFQWFSIGLPFSLALLAICWWYISKIAFRFTENTLAGSKAEIRNQLQELGPMNSSEKRVLLVFALTALAWISRSYLIQPYLPMVNDTLIALCGALILFLLPSEKGGAALLNWDDMDKLPWGVLLLFGGGIALALGFDQSGLADWLGGHLSALAGISLVALLLILIIAVNFLTEITSNLATTSVILPTLAPLAVSVNMHPFGLMIAAAVAASCAFMLPVATPPNALVFGTGQLKIGDMLRSGVWLNLISAVLLLALIYFILPLFWGIDLGSYPNSLKF